jgi:hypothetical protein
MDAGLVIPSQTRLPRERRACENGTWNPPTRSENEANRHSKPKQRNVNLFRKIAVALVIVALLTGCASFTYNRLDWLIPWYVDGYVDLTGDQREALRERLAPSLEWHRREELARYMEILDRIEADLDGPVDSATVRAWADDALAAAQRVEKTMMGVALEFGAEVSDAQVKEFIASLWERQREFEEEFLERSAAEYAEDDFDNLENLLERFLGRLSAEQKAVLRAAAGELVRFDKAWLEDRRNWLRTLEDLLAREPGWQDAVMRAYEARIAMRSPEYRQAFEHNMDRITAAYAEVLSSMSTRQRENAAEEFDDLRRMLRKLMDRPETALLETPAAYCTTA